jgi:hypothetical protein
MNTLTKTKVKLARSLELLERLIAEDLAAATEAMQQAGMPYYRAAGEKLLEAEVYFDTREEFYAWAEEKFGVRETQTKLYMKYATKQGEEELKFLRDSSSWRADDQQPKQYKTLSEVEGRKDKTHYPSWAKPVRESVGRLNVGRMRQEEQEKEKERKLQHDLAMRLIDIGYKVLATKLHPDKGGSREAMARLNKVRDILKGAI